MKLVMDEVEKRKERERESRKRKRVSRGLEYLYYI
jgi:hypothetical protein